MPAISKSPDTYDSALKSLTRALFVQAREDDTRCNGCEYERQTVDREPYGETTALRYGSECTCRDAKDCPGVIELMNRIVEGVADRGLL